MADNLPVVQERQLAVQEPRVPVAVGANGVNLQSYDEMARFCLAISKSRLAPKGFETPEAIMVAVQYGMELGLGPMTALQSIAVINGRPSLWGDAALGLCQSHKDFESIHEEPGDEAATCTVKRRGMPAVTRTFGIAQAKRAGLWGKAGPWTQYPARMLQMRARSWALRDSFADALRGVAIREEQQDVPQRQEKPVEARIALPDDEPPKALPEPATGLPEGQEGQARDIDPVTGEFKW